MRVLFLLAVLQASGFLTLSRLASARGGEALSRAGAALLESLPGAQADSSPRQLTLNGVTLRLVTVFTREDVTSVLDRIEAGCRRRGGIADAESNLERLVRGTLREAASLLLAGVRRFETDDEGLVSCIDTGGPLTPEALASRLGQWLESGDLSAVGELRYAFARRTAHGTHLLLLWTEGRAPILRMFPKEGDSPGVDPEGVPRAPGTRRLLSASEQGMPYSLSVYVSKHRGVPELAAFYQEALLEKGFTVEGAPPDGNAGDTVRFLARRDGALVLVHVEESGEGKAQVRVGVLG